MRKFAKWGAALLALLCAFGLGRGGNAYSETDLALAREDAYNSGYHAGFAQGEASRQEACTPKHFPQDGCRVMTKVWPKDCAGYRSLLPPNRRRFPLPCRCLHRFRLIHRLPTGRLPHRMTPPNRWYMSPKAAPSIIGVPVPISARARSKEVLQRRKMQDTNPAKPAIHRNGGAS